MWATLAIGLFLIGCMILAGLIAIIWLPRETSRPTSEKPQRPTLLK